MRVIKCKSKESLERLEAKLIKMHKRVAIMHKKDLGNTLKDKLLKVDVLLLLDESV